MKDCKLGRKLNCAGSDKKKVGSSSSSKMGQAASELPSSEALLSNTASRALATAVSISFLTATRMAETIAVYETVVAGTVGAPTELLHQT